MKRNRTALPDVCKQDDAMNVSYTPDRQHKFSFVNSNFLSPPIFLLTNQDPSHTRTFPTTYIDNFSSSRNILMHTDVAAIPINEIASTFSIQR